MKKTLYVQPAVHNNNYTEFMIPKNQLQNFRLIDLGVENYTVNGGGDPRKYNILTGVVSLIDTISLYNDSELVNQCRNCPAVMEFTQLSEGAMMNYSKTQALNQTQLNLDVDAVIEIQAQNLTNNLATKNPSYLDLWRFLPFLMGLDIEKFTELQKSLKNKDRKRVRQILKTSNVIHGDKLNLRLVIQYTSKSPSQLFVNGNDGDTYNILKPVLVCDQISGAMPSNQFQVVYDNWENEMVTITPEANGVDKREDRILYGCIGKYVSDVWLLNSPSVNTNTGLKDAGSYGLLNEMVNLVVNEKQLIPNNQCNSPARKQMYLNYSNQSMMTSLLSNIVAHGGTANNELYGANTTTAYNFVGTQSYLNLNIDDVISSLRLYLDFKAYNAGVSLGDVNVNLFYKCKQTLTYSNGQVLIAL
jgi:hypothetical protein